MSTANLSTSGQPEGKTVRHILTNVNYRNLLIAQFVSDFGDGVYAMALLWAMKVLTGSGAQMSIVLTAELLPMIFIGIFAGVYVDLGRKKNIMLVADLVRGATVVVLGFVWYFDQMQAWMLILAAVVLSTFSAFFSPARMVSIRTLVPNESMMQAQSMSQTVQTMVGLCAPAVSAVLLSINIAWAFWFNAVSYFISFIFILLIRHEDLVKKIVGKVDTETIKAALKEGFRTVFKTPLLRNMIFYIVLLNFMFAPVSVLFPIFSDTATKLAAYDTAFFVGILLGSIILGLFSKSRKIVPMTVGLLLIMSGFLSLAYLDSFYFLLAFIALIGIGMPIVNGTLTAVFMTAIPREVLGRAGGMLNVLAQSAKPISLSLVGSLILLFEVRELFLIISILGLCVILLMLLNPVVRKAE